MELDTSKPFVDRYRLISRLGAGGMGVVYKARDIHLDRDVAIKMLLPNVANIAKVRFFLEAVASAKLNHPNILQVLDFNKDDEERFFLVMDYLKGEGLDDLLDRQGALSIETALPILLQVSAGLAHAHSKGIMHRDIKPSNVMLVEDEHGKQTAKLVDFGLAKVQEMGFDATRTGSMLGSPLYMAPEQSHGKDADQRSDLYSFGCMMFEMLVGRAPYTGDNPLETMMMHRSEEIPDLGDYFGEELPNELAELNRKCLSKDPDDRIQSASEVEQLLQTLLGREDEVVYTREEKQVEIRKSKTAIVFYLVAFLLTLAITSNFAYFLKGNHGPKRRKLAPQRIKARESRSKFVVKIKKGKEWWKSNTGVSDEDLDAILNETEKPIAKLDLHNTSITNEGLSMLADLHIEDLDISDNRSIDDECMLTVAKIKEIEDLDIQRTGVTNQGLYNLINLKKLKRLHMDRLTGVTDAGLEFVVKQWPELELLDIQGTAITSKGFKSLRRLKKLHALFIGSLEHIKDDDLDNILNLPLYELGVASSHFTPQGVEKLKKIKSLKIVYGTVCPGFTEESVAGFRRDRPDMEIRGIRLEDSATQSLVDLFADKVGTKGLGESSSYQGKQ